MKTKLCGLQLMLALVAPAFAENTQKWSCKVFEDENHVASFELKSGDKKQVHVDSDKSLMISFRTDVDPARAAKYEGKPHPIIMSQNGFPFCASATSAGTKFRPVKGRIDLVIENKSDEAIKVCVVANKKPVDDSDEESADESEAE